MKPGVMAAVVVAAIIIIGGAVFFLSDNSTTNPKSTSTTQTQTNSNDNEHSASENSGHSHDNDEETVKPASGTYTADQVKGHHSEDDCWTIIAGSVYDITSYIPRHPGGEEILRACGEEATTLFESRTTEAGETVGSGTPHSSNAQSQLESLKIGVLAVE